MKKVKKKLVEPKEGKRQSLIGRIIYIYVLSLSRKKVYILELSLFGMLKLALALQFIVTNAYFSVA